MLGPSHQSSCAPNFKPTVRTEYETVKTTGIQLLSTPWPSPYLNCGQLARLDGLAGYTSRMAIVWMVTKSTWLVTLLVLIALLVVCIIACCMTMDHSINWSTIYSDDNLFRPCLHQSSYKVSIQILLLPI